MKLYVIGNGFDVHHGIDTRYTSFGLYLKNNYSETYELLIEHYGLSDLNPNYSTSMSDPLWSEFETSMSLLDKDSVLEANMDAMPNYSSDDFRDRDRYTLEIEMERILGLLTTDLYKAFKEFILAVQFPQFDHSRSVNIDRDAVYLTFNYTDTLSQYYAIPDENVLFIHGKADEHVDELILGHSLADVDLSYFQKLEQSVRPDAKWVATFYDPDDEKVHCDTLTGLGIANVAVVRMEQI
ncbi:bacteriophage abortive infection AbiH family protein [Xenorhabdus sp. KJ12.1]|uniref:bacteriophage abortive infection AbiH family protein n=1 Tax=Xenorhabdus sp. KJ12.1 TaxID=1851571 RepID=UPI000C0553CB|nr:bacteriophage abortive infection AbiH family protein [Xenorhabdus sp. KJ12.1]PHM72075.1 hypothetical protein Xekj_00870 [Xenorhabdus sp. KJ12.1]